MQSAGRRLVDPGVVAGVGEEDKLSTTAEKNGSAAAEERGAPPLRHSGLRRRLFLFQSRALACFRLCCLPGFGGLPREQLPRGLWLLRREGGLPGVR